MAYRAADCRPFYGGIMLLYLKTVKNFASLPLNARYRAQHDAGVRLLSRAVLFEYGIKISLSDIAANEHGKPYFIKAADIHFSISHSGEYAAVLLSKYPCGVDIERVKRVKPALIPRYCTDYEQELIKKSGGLRHSAAALWTLKESYVKAIGRGAGFGFKNIEFKTLGDKPKANRPGIFETAVYGDAVISSCILTDNKPRV